MWYALVIVLVAGSPLKSVASHGWETKQACEEYLLTEENQHEVAALKQHLREAGVDAKFVDNVCERDPLNQDGTPI